MIELYPIIKSKQSVTGSTFDHFSEIVCRSTSYVLATKDVTLWLSSTLLQVSIREQGKNVEMMAPQCSLLVIISSRTILVISSTAV